MKLTVYYDGQYWIGVVEEVVENRLKSYRYVFGREPKEADIMLFIFERLPILIASSEQKGILKEKVVGDKRINPKKLQRIVAKEMKQKGITTKSQEAIKEARSQKIIKKKCMNKEEKKRIKDMKYQYKQKKAKEKKKGH